MKSCTSYTSILQYCKSLPVLILIPLLLLTFISACTSVSGKQKFHYNLENETTLDLTEQEPAFDHDSEITLSYDTDLLKLETVTELDLEGVSGEELLFEVGGDGNRASFELEFDPEKSGLETYVFTGELEPNQDLSVALEYESDYPEEGETAEANLVLTLFRRISEDLSVEIEGTFPEKNHEITVIPSETVINLAGLKAGGLELETELQFEEKELEGTQLDFGTESQLSNRPDLELEGTINLELSEDFLEFEPELESERGNLYLETKVHSGTEDLIEKLELEEAGLTELVFPAFELELANNLESREVEINLEREHDGVNTEIGLELGAGDGDGLFALEQVNGILSWATRDYVTVKLEGEATASSLSELTFASEYDF